MLASPHLYTLTHAGILLLLKFVLVLFPSLSLTVERNCSTDRRTSLLFLVGRASHEVFEGRASHEVMVGKLDDFKRMTPYYSYVRPNLYFVVVMVTTRRTPTQGVVHINTVFIGEGHCPHDDACRARQ
jgi:hypothetical protein